MVLLSPLPALAFVQRAGNNIVFSQTIQDDLYIAGGSVTVTATIDGDVAAAGGAVELDGQTSGGALAAGGTLKIGGTIGRTLRAAGGTLSVDSRIGRDAVLAGGTVNVDRAAQIGRDLVVGGGNITISGTVGRNALIGGGDVVIGGTVQGNARVEANRIVLLPSARIGGRLRLAANQPIEVQSGAQISGGIEEIPAPPRQAGLPLTSGLRLWARVAEGLGLLVLGLVVFAVAPQGASVVASEVGRRFGRSLLTGFILLVVVPIAAALALATVIGIPLSMLALLLYLATLYPGQIFVAGWVGALILRVVGRGITRTPPAYSSVVVGTLVLVLLFAIPYGGWAIRLVTILVGFGALWLAIWRTVTSRPEAAEARPSATA